MDKSVLRIYTSLKMEQKDLGERIEEISRKISQLPRSSRTPDDEEWAELRKSLERYEKVRAELSKVTEACENFIDQLSDPTIRTILRLRFLDGRPWRDVSRRFGKSGQWAYLKVQRFFQTKN